MGDSAFFDNVWQTDGEPPSLEFLESSASSYYRLSTTIINGRRVILKSLKEEYRELIFYRDLLRKEYEIGRYLFHPNIVTTLDFKEIEPLGETIVLEFFDGENLESFLKSNKLNVREASELIMKLCDALHYIHSRRIVHRDIKPANIMVSRDGLAPVIIDFGLADSDNFVNCKLPGGTLDYAAPELIAGKRTNYKADIYSLGRLMQKILPVAPRWYARTADLCLKENAGERPDSLAVKSLLQKGLKTKSKAVYAFVGALLLIVAILTFFLMRPQADESTMADNEVAEMAHGNEEAAVSEKIIATETPPAIEAPQPLRENKEENSGT